MIFCRSKESAERTLQNILPFIEGKLFLKVNRNKTCIEHIEKVKYLGYSFYYQEEFRFRFRVHSKTIEKIKKKIKELTSRSNAWSNEMRILKLKQYIRGWINYFKLADMENLLKRTDEWMRRRIRVVYWKQWKKIRTKIRKLRSLKLPEWAVLQLANSRKGIWRSLLVLNCALTKQVISNLGYTYMVDYYLKVREN